mgnify:CR=1 FL=1
MSSLNQNNEFDILIAGGGAAGIGLAASLKNRDQSLSIGIIEPSEDHYYQPSWTLVGGGAFNVKSSKRKTKDIIPAGVSWIKDKITGFSPETNEVRIAHGNPVRYKYLAVATGLRIKWEAIPGLTDTIGKNGVTSNYSYDYSPYTWELVKQMKSGKAIFTQPPMPIKCPGAPQKAMYLSCYEWEKQGKLKNIEVELNNAGAALFGVADFVPPLMEYVKKYDATLNFNCNLISVDGPNQKAIFAVKDADGNTSQIEKLGNDTRERYDNYLRNEPLKEAFRCFTYAPVENRIDSKNFNNPHHNISNCSDINSFNNLDRSVNSGISGPMSGSPDKRRDRSVSIENKFLKIKKQSNSASTSSLLRQYRMSNNTNNSTSTSLSYMRRSPSFNNQS